jgi:hypothetical protein
MISCPFCGFFQEGLVGQLERWVNVHPLSLKGDVKRKLRPRKNKNMAVYGCGLSSQGEIGTKREEKMTGTRGFCFLHRLLKSLWTLETKLISCLFVF